MTRRQNTYDRRQRQVQTAEASAMPPKPARCRRSPSGADRGDCARPSTKPRTRGSLLRRRGKGRWRGKGRCSRRAASRPKTHTLGANTAERAHNPSPACGRLNERVQAAEVALREANARVPPANYNNERRRTISDAAQRADRARCGPENACAEAARAPGSRRRVRRCFRRLQRYRVLCERFLLVA